MPAAAAHRRRSSARPARTPRAAQPPASPDALRLAVEYVPIASLQVYDRNARAHSDQQIDALARNIRTFGFVVPIAIDADNQVIAGHGRIRAAAAAGLEQLPAIRITHLSPGQVRALRLADNALCDRSDWDRTTLRQELLELQAAGLADMAGFDAGELAEILQPWDLAEPEPPAEPGPGRHVVSRPGDLWILGTHRLLVGDSTSPEDVARLMNQERAHLVNIDPPYGVAYVGKTADALTIDNDRHRDDDLVNRLLLPAFRNGLAASREDAPWYIWHATSTRRDFEHAMAAAGLVELQMLTWPKPHFVMGRGDYQWGSEPCFYAARQGARPPFYGDRCQSTVWRIACRDADGRLVVSAVGGLRLSDGRGGELYISHKPPAAKGKNLRLFRLEAGQELIIAGASGPESDTWEVDRPSANKDHPTEKPIELAVRAIANSTRPGEIVLDLFGGAGFTLLGAERTGRQARVMEMDPRFADVICRRWAELTDKRPIRESDGREFPIPRPEAR